MRCGNFSGEVEPTCDGILELLDIVLDMVPQRNTISSMVVAIGGYLLLSSNGKIWTKGSDTEDEKARCAASFAVRKNSEATVTRIQGRISAV